MKQNYNLSRLIILISLVFSFLIFFANNLSAQSCDQLEILYTEPDCFRSQGSAGLPADEKGCKQVSACEDTPYKYTSSITGLGFTYNWTATGPLPVSFFPNNASSQVSIVWPQIGVYILTLTVTDLGGNVFTNCITVDVKEKPVANFTFTPNNVCAGSTIQFTSTSTYPNGGMLYSWDFGDPSSNSNYSTSATPNHLYANSGVYDVKLIVSSFSNVQVGGTQGHETWVQKVCCSDTITKKVTIVPGTIKIECITTVCANQLETYTAVGCANPIWLSPIGGSIISSVGNQITIQWGNGAIQGQIQATCPGGCTASVPVPIVPAVPVPVGNLFPCLSATESYSLPVLPGTFYQWQLIEQPSGNNLTSNVYTYPDNNTAWINLNNITGGVLTPGNSYQLFITVANKHNCCGPITNFITITPRETFSAFSDQTICLGGAASLVAFPSPGTFNWAVLPITGVSPNIGTGSSFNPSFNTAGTYIATVTETANTYCNSMDQVNITVLPATPAPGTIVGPATICLNDILAYSTSSPAPSGYHYSWSITAGTATFEPGALANTTGDNVNIMWTSVPGTISIVLERNTFPSCPSSPVTMNVSGATPGSVSGTPNVCVDSNGSYTLTGGTIPPGTTVNWTVSPAGIGTIVAGQGTTNVSIKWHGTGGAGPWSATINATTTCGPALPATVTIYPKFTFTLSQNASDICQPAGVTLTASAVANSPTYLWSNSSITNPTSVFAAGTYTLLVTNAGGCTATNQINVIDPFKVTTSCSVGICTGAGMQEVLTVSATAPGAITYQWFTGTSPGGSPIGGANTNTYTATVGGNYYVEVYYGTCMKFIQFNIEQVCCPDADKPTISAVQTSCLDFTFTGASLIAGKPYTLFFGDGTSTTGTTNGSTFTKTHTYPTAGIYCVKLRIENGACGVNWAVTSVVVPIKAQFLAQLKCDGCLDISNTSIDLSSAPATVTYNWNFGDPASGPLNTSLLQNPAPHCYATGGTYTVTLTMNYNGAVSCSDIATYTFTYIPISITVVPSPVCTDNAVTFSSLSGSSIISTYTWAFGDGNFAYASPTTHIYTIASPPNYNATLTVVDNTGTLCAASASINVLQGFTVSLQPGYICPSGTAILTPTIVGAPGIYTYAWEEFVLGSWVPASGANAGSTYIASTPGIYHVVVTAPNSCIVTSNQVPVIAVPNPVAKISVSPSKKLCSPGAMVTFTSDNHLPGYTSDWYEGSIANFIGTGQTFNYNVSATNNYILVLTNQYGCTNTCQIVIEVNAPPAIPVILPPGPICEGTPTVIGISPITFPPANYNYLWNTGESTNSITVYAAGVYSVVVIDKITGCTSTNLKVVNKRPIVDLFPHYCQDVTCVCAVPFTIYGPKPLVGYLTPAPPYVIDWYQTPSTYLFTGQNLTPVATGSYYVVMTDPSTGCASISETYSVNVPTETECAECSCEGGTWGDVTLTTINPTSTIQVQCPQTLQIPCRVPYIINGSYNCSAIGCDSYVMYSITDPLGNTVTGTLPYTFMAPQTGLYTVILTAYCNGKQCTTCKISFNACPALEVNLVRFDGKKVGEKVELDWETASEKGNDYYLLERADEGQKFTNLAKIPSKNSTSNEKQIYSFTDLFPFNGINYYKLKAVDIDGKITNSKIISVDFENIRLTKIYPNPSKSDLVTIDLPMESDGKIKLEWFDIVGRLVKTNNLIGNKGQNKFEINIADIPTGKYIVRINSENRSKVGSNLNFEKL